jgi:hypothetical protein
MNTADTTSMRITEIARRLLPPATQPQDGYNGRYDMEAIQ